MSCLKGERDLEAALFDFDHIVRIFIFGMGLPTLRVVTAKTVFEPAGNGMITHAIVVLVQNPFARCGNDDLAKTIDVIASFCRSIVMDLRPRRKRERTRGTVVYSAAVTLLVVLEDGKVNAIFDKQISVVFQAIATIVVDFNNGALCDEVFLSVLRNAQTAARRGACLSLVPVDLQGRSAVDIQGVAHGDAIQAVARAGNRGALNEQLASRKAM